MKSFVRFYVFLLVFCGLIVLGVTFREDISISENVKPIPPVPEEIIRTFKLYFVDKDKLAIENRTVTTKNIHFEKPIVQELIKGPRNKTLSSTIPQDAILLSIETIDKICYINFSAEYIEHGKWQEIGEDLIIWSLVNSLTQLDNVYKVQILVEGERIDFLENDYSINQPFSRNEDLVQKSVVTYFSVIKDFLESLKMERFDRAYSMLDKSSTMRVSFQEFRELMTGYMKELRDFEIAFYNTQKFSDKTIMSLKYIKNSDTQEITFYQEWKMIEVDGEIKIVLDDKEDYVD